MQKTIFIPVSAPLRSPVTKLGGQPTWLELATWPISARLGVPMRFIAQFRLNDDDAASSLAYVVMTDDDDSGSAETWAAEAGENAVIIQPAGRIPPFLTVVAALGEGPGLSGEFLPESREVGAGEYVTQFLGAPGVAPVWLQGDQTPGFGWRLIAQLDSQATPAAGLGGDWVGYAFVSPDGREGRFLWQCT